MRQFFALAFPRTGLYFVAPGHRPTDMACTAAWYGSLRKARRAAARYGCVVVPGGDLAAGPIFGPGRSRYSRFVTRPPED